MTHRPTYFSTRDLLMMAALAALGGLTGTYVNAFGDAVHAAIGLPGGSQWAAGLHVLWLTLAVGLTGRAGAASTTGALKGCVELLTGNTHGLIVVLVDLGAGLLVDLGFLPFRRDGRAGFCVAGGLAAASNVLVFQLFAALPADRVTVGLLALLAGVAAVSGVLFAGLLGHALLQTLRRAGVVHDVIAEPRARWTGALVMGWAGLLVGGLGLFLTGAADGGGAPAAGVRVEGLVAAAYTHVGDPGDPGGLDDPGDPGDPGGELGDGEPGVAGGVEPPAGALLVRDVVRRARPRDGADTVAIEAGDGYTYRIPLDALRTDDRLRLEPTPGAPGRYHTAGSDDREAAVRDVRRIVVETGDDGGASAGAAAGGHAGDAKGEPDASGAAPAGGVPAP